MWLARKKVKMEKLKSILAYLEKVNREIEKQKSYDYDCLVCLDCLAHIISRNYDEVHEFEEMHKNHLVISFVPNLLDDITPILKFLRWYLYQKV